MNDGAGKSLDIKEEVLENQYMNLHITEKSFPILSIVN